MRPSSFQGFNPGLDNVLGRIKVGLANFEVDDIFALTFQGARLIQDFKGSFRTEPRHAFGKAKFVLGRFFHRCKGCHYIPSASRFVGAAQSSDCCETIVCHFYCLAAGKSRSRLRITGWGDARCGYRFTETEPSGERTSSIVKRAAQSRWP